MAKLIMEQATPASELEVSRAYPETIHLPELCAHSGAEAQVVQHQRQERGPGFPPELAAALSLDWGCAGENTPAELRAHSADREEGQEPAQEPSRVEGHPDHGFQEEGGRDRPSQNLPRSPPAWQKSGLHRCERLLLDIFLHIYFYILKIF